MKLFGLTGGIGSGKSTVSEALIQLGAVVVDADAIVKELQTPGHKVFVDMVEHFGDSIVASDGTLDRAAVAEIVFNDAEELAALGGIVHPAVQAEIAARVEAQRDLDNVVILDIPLLVESGWEGLLGTIVVDLHPELAIERIVEHRGSSETDARARIANQVDRSERNERADFLIDNSGSLEDLGAQITKCWEWINGR